MKKFEALSIMLLLSFLSFSVLQVSSGTTKTHHESKAIISLDDSTLKLKWDDEKKHPFDLPLLYTLALFIIMATILLDNVSRNFDRKFVFLLPIFYQSNYVISSPELKS
jgi:hypothetical protein